MTGSRAHDFRDALARGGVVFDGAMGTSLYARGHLYTQSFEEMNLSQPEKILQAHQSFAEAGAQVIETNTFGANQVRLATHGHADKVEAINRAGVEIARTAAGEEGFVAGSVGPTGLLWEALSDDERSDLARVFLDQCRALVSAGADLLLLETFRQPAEIQIALEAAREAAGECPVVGCVSFDEDGTTADGSEPERVASLLSQWGADAVGVNCATGPAGVYEMVTRMGGPNLPTVAIPNAGMPQQIEGRLAYQSTPEYFQVFARRLFKAGVSAVGGCCGTTPEHIEKIAAAARMVRGGTGPEVDTWGMREKTDASLEPAPGIRVVPTAEKGVLGAKVAAGEFFVSVEINPPPGLTLAKALDAARRLRDGGVDLINVADGARAQARMGNLSLCSRIQREVGLPTLMHVTTRDRNLLGLFAYVLSAHDMGVRNLVVITGDPPKMGDFPDATAVYDLDSVGLLRLLAQMNRGFDAGGKPLGAATSFFCATGAEPAAVDYERELERLRAKRDAGAELVMTQPVYDPAVLERMLDDIAPLELPVLVGLLPLASHRNAEFLHHEVPGMRIPDPIRERMRKAGSGEPARREGVAIAREMLGAVRHRVAGAYLMPPLGLYDLALDVLK